MERTAPQPGERLVRAASKAVKATETPRTMRFVASDESVDRYGDIIRAKGWQLDNFKANPVLLFGHDSKSPIGRVEASVIGNQLLAEATFAPAGKSQLADEVWNLVDADILRAVSVGFLPTAAPNPIWKDGDKDSGILTGFEFIAQELLELSVVSVPANPQALALARSLASEATIRRSFLPEPGASAQLAAVQRRRSIGLARLRVGHFKGGASNAP